jgi:hypothetical protein
MQGGLEELEELMESLDPIIENPNEGLNVEPRKFTNFEALKTGANLQAKNVIKKLIKFYLTPEMIKDQWTAKKVSTDVTNLSNLIWQMECSQYLLTKILEEIDGGASNFQMFKTTADLQKANMEILKYYKQYVQIIEQEYSDFSGNFEIYKQKGTLPSMGKENNINNINGHTHRGSKSMLESVKKLRRTEELTDEEWNMSDSLFEDNNKESIDEDI